ncbi:unnamed protein product, partial [Meganyctiphanes norvegica]
MAITQRYITLPLQGLAQSQTKVTSSCVAFTIMEITGCYGSDVMDVVEMKYVPLELDYAMKWGHWGDTEFCPEGSFAYGFRIKVEDSTAKDDTALNGIRLICRSPGDVGSDGVFPKKKAWEANITSTVQKWGTWRGRMEGQKINFRIYIFSNLLILFADRQKGIFNQTNSRLEADTRLCESTPTSGLGSTFTKIFWSSWGRVICGIQTRVEEHLPIYEDDTALNDVRMFCCELDPDYLYF